MARAVRTSADDLSSDRARALALTPVSRETAERLDRFVELLSVWQKITNLIASSTLAHLWTRHIADGLQLLALAPEARLWVDLGSGGGFPGLPLACALTDRQGSEIHLVESNRKKAAFLREAVRITAVPAVVHATRIEDFVRDFRGRADVVTARALAPLGSLLYYVEPLLGPGSIALLPKGQDVEAEIAEASKSWAMNAELVPSRTDPQGRIVVVRGLKRYDAAL